MSIGSVSAYRQLQNWSANQASITSQVLGSASTTVDNSAAFTSIAANSFGGETSLAGQAALTRIQNQTTAAQTAKSGTTASTVDPRVAAAKAAGAAVLSNLGLTGNSSSSSTSSTSSSSGPYAAPTNPSTGYGYVVTSAGDQSSLSAVNLLA